jgi:hypothetical protein
MMTYDANLSTVDLEIERLRPERRRHGPRNTNNLIPAVEMIIGDWHVDDLGILTREITARG